MAWVGELKTSTGECILYSGSEEDHQRGVGKEARTALLRLCPVNKRILIAKFNSRYAKLTVILLYAPTNDAKEVRVKGESYEQLQTVLESTRRHDVLQTQDANIEAGEDTLGWETMMGR